MCAASPLKLLSAELLRYDEGGLPPDLVDDLKVIAAKTSMLISVRAGEFLHKLDDTKHSEKEVKSVINMFPRAISHTLEGGQLPIHSAVTYHPDTALSFIPLLAQEGIIRNVGGHNKRGGLLSPVPHSSRNSNLIQLLANISKPKDPVGADKMCLEALKRLKDVGLLCRQDIKEHNLLFNSNHPLTKARFEFLVQWDPEMLKMPDSENGIPLIHDTLKITTNIEDALKRFELVVQTSFRHFPDEYGLLFQKHGGSTACEGAFSLFGRQTTMGIIRNHIPTSDNRPILHSVIKYVPQFMDLFTRHYFSATYVTDSDGRSLFLASLASGNVSFESNATFYSTCTDEQVGGKDPVTDLFPFALAASGNLSDLDAVFTLLRRAPGLIYTKTRKRKRKLENLHGG